MSHPLVAGRPEPARREREQGDQHQRGRDRAAATGPARATDAKIDAGEAQRVRRDRCTSRYALSSTIGTTISNSRNGDAKLTDCSSRARPRPGRDRGDAHHDAHRGDAHHDAHRGDPRRVEGRSRPAGRAARRRISRCRAASRGRSRARGARHPHGGWPGQSPRHARVRRLRSAAATRRWSAR